jgi:microcystin-dependent protein
VVDVRPADDPLTIIAALQKQVDDLASTMNVRVQERPTGDVEISIRSTPKSGQLFLQGQIVNRADYPVLWQWVQDQGLLGVGLFGPADGSTTFGLPDWRGKVVRGVDSGGAVGDQTGADNKVLTTAQMVNHTHAVSVADHGNHNHSLTGGTMETEGDHFGHAPDSGPHECAPQAGGIGAAAWNMTGAHFGGHSHTAAVFSIATGAGSHSVSQSSIGSTAAIDFRQQGVGINWAIWT